MAVLALVRYDQHPRIVPVSLHVFPRRTAPHTTALVIAPAEL